MSRLPAFLLALGNNVDWTEEKPCFMGVANALAGLYSIADVEEKISATTSLDPDHEWSVQHVVIPAMQQLLRPPKSLTTAFVEVASLERMFRVFERC